MTCKAEKEQKEKLREPLRNQIKKKQEEIFSAEEVVKNLKKIDFIDKKIKYITKRLITFLVLVVASIFSINIVSRSGAQAAATVSAVLILCTAISNILCGAAGKNANCPDKKANNSNPGYFEVFIWMLLGFVGAISGISKASALKSEYTAQAGTDVKDVKVAIQNKEAEIQELTKELNALREELNKI